uniref:Small ribosomal subunit protein uS3m n=1 Tax=Phlebia radiata TaxID=5308 RepID=L8B9E0_PHLRA|nr:ribosomal protein S3 [Phlebia radiata]CCE89257.1 ribosomal protein S3 [Phlebia radiata]
MNQSLKKQATLKISNIKQKNFKLNKTSVQKNNLILHPKNNTNLNNLNLYLKKATHTKLNLKSYAQIILKSKKINANTKTVENSPQTFSLNTDTKIINNQNNSEASNLKICLTALSQRLPQNSDIIPTFNKDLKQTNLFNNVNLIPKNVENCQKELDFPTIFSLKDSDNQTIELKEICKRLIKQNKIKIENKLKGTKQLKLRKHIRLLSNFKSNLALNKNFVYKFNHNHYAKKNLKNTSDLLNDFFLTFNYIISQPIFKFTPQKLVIQLFIFNSNINKNLIGKEKQKYLIELKQIKQILKINLLKLSLKLSQILKMSVVLDLVKLPNLNSEGQILANSIGIKTDKLGKKFIMIVKKLLNKTNLIHPDQLNEKVSGYKNISNMIGINVKLAGRMSRQAIIANKTVQSYQIGSLNRQHSDIITKARYTAKNRRGIYCYTITISHKCY